jgi:hypothetical protein
VHGSTKKYFKFDQVMVDAWFVEACNRGNAAELKVVFGDDIEYTPSAHWWSKALEMFGKTKKIALGRYLLNHAKAPKDFTRQAILFYYELGNEKAVWNLLNKSTVERHAPTHLLANKLFLRAVTEDSDGMFKIFIGQTHHALSVSTLEQALTIRPKKPSAGLYDFSHIRIDTHPMHKEIYKKLGRPDPNSIQARCSHFLNPYTLPLELLYGAGASNFLVPVATTSASEAQSAAAASSAQ